MSDYERTQASSENIAKVSEKNSYLSGKGLTNNAVINPTKMATEVLHHIFTFPN